MRVHLACAEERSCHSFSEFRFESTLSDVRSELNGLRRFSRQWKEIIVAIGTPARTELIIVINYSNEHLLNNFIGKKEIVGVTVRKRGKLLAYGECARLLYILKLRNKFQLCFFPFCNIILAEIHLLVSFSEGSVCTAVGRR